MIPVPINPKQFIAKDTNQIKSYCDDLRDLLSETDIVKSKAFLRSFVEKVAIESSECTIRYKLPLPSNW